MFLKQGSEQILTAHDGSKPAKDFWGKYLKDAKNGVKHPVIMVPGIVSTGLDICGAKPCLERYFRQRLWGSMTTARTFLLDWERWLEHLILSKDGLDRDGIILRVAAGHEATDYLIGPYWVWARVIYNLAHIVYDQNSMHFTSYDWRLSTKSLQET